MFFGICYGTQQSVENIGNHPEVERPPPQLLEVSGDQLLIKASHTSQPTSARIVSSQEYNTWEALASTVNAGAPTNVSDSI